MFLSVAEVEGSRDDLKEKEENIPVNRSDFYCELCAVDCLNNTGKLIHSLSESHIKVYQSNSRVAGTINKRCKNKYIEDSRRWTSFKKSIYQEESTLQLEQNYGSETAVESKQNGSEPFLQEHDVKSESIQGTSTVPQMEYKHSFSEGQSKTCNILTVDMQTGHTAKKKSKHKNKNSNKKKKKVSRYDEMRSSDCTTLLPQFRRSVCGNDSVTLGNDCRNVNFEHQKDSAFLENFVGLTKGHCQEELGGSVIPNELNHMLKCTPKSNKPHFVEKGSTSLSDETSKTCSEINALNSAFKSCSLSCYMQKDINCSQNTLKAKPVDSKVIWKLPNGSCCRRIIVKGLPTATGEESILKVFSKYGFIKSYIFIGTVGHIEYFEWQSVERIFIDQAQQKIKVNGKDVEIEKNSCKPIKDFQIGKVPENIRKIFSSEERFCERIDKLLEKFYLDPKEIHRQQQVCLSVASSLKDFSPEVYPFGSRITQLATKYSDLDIFIDITIPHHLVKTKCEKSTQGLIIHQAAQSIRRSSDFRKVVEIPNASVPIIICTHVPSGLRCDLSFQEPYGVYNTQLILFYLSLDHRVRLLILFIRYWSHTHGLSGKGKLSSHSLNLMCIFYLQQIPEKPVLPSVALLMKLAREHEKVTVGHWDCGYCEAVSLIPKTVNESSLFEIVKGFFEYYSVFDSENLVICPFLGRPVQKKTFHPGKETLLPHEFAKYKSNCLLNIVKPLETSHALCIQDPLVQNHNVSKQSSKPVVQHFQMCCDLYGH